MFGNERIRIILLIQIPESRGWQGALSTSPLPLSSRFLSKNYFSLSLLLD